MYWKKNHSMNKKSIWDLNKHIRGGNMMKVQEFEVDSKKLKQEHMTYDKK